MKKLVFLAFILAGNLLQAQEYMSCISLDEHGYAEKAQNCLRGLESKYATDPSFYFYNMLQAVNSGDKQRADHLLVDMQKYPPADFHVIAAKTIYLVSNQDITQAKQVYDTVLKDHKKAPVDALIQTTAVFFTRKARDPEYALLWINTLEKEIKQPHPGWCLLKGDYYASLGDQGNALNMYNKAIDADQKNALAYFKKAVAYRRIKNSIAALTELETALRIYPDFPLALEERGELLIEQGRLNEGMELYQKYFTLIPNDNVTRIRYGAAMFYAKKYEDADKIADQVLVNDPSNISAMKLKGYTCYELGKYEEGLTLLNNFLAQTDTSFLQARDYEYLAKYHLKAGSDSLAMNAYLLSFRYPGSQPETFSEAGSMMVKKARYEDALYTYETKTARFKGTSADYFNYGRSALALEKYELADSLFGKVCELQPTWPNGFLMRANANSHLDPGSTEGRALPYYEQFVSLAEADTANASKYKSGLLESYRYLGYYHFLKKDIEKSREYWNKVLLLEPNDKQAKEVLKQL